MSAEVRVTAPAKINLTLGVGEVREDGFHPLATVYQAIGLYDEVVLRPADPDAGHPDGDLTVSADGVDVEAVPTDDTNLVLRAVRLLGEHHDREALPVSMHLRKRIPVAGGLAGGSTDAAAALLGADTLFGLGTSRADLAAIAAELGSDVPFCLVGGTALGAGRGEQVMPVMTRGEYWWVVLPDRGGLSTPGVYSEFDRLHRGRALSQPEVPDELLAALRAGDPERLGVALVNDLEPAALSLRPDLAQRLESSRALGALGALVSGSGPTTLLLARDPDHARESAAMVRAGLDLDAIAVKAPVHGARVTASRASGSAP